MDRILAKPKNVGQDVRLLKLLLPPYSAVLYRLPRESHPTSDWTLQPLREALPGGHDYQFLIHDRDSIFSSDLDEELKSSFGWRVLRTPVRPPKANACGERLIGTVRRECLDFMIPLHEQHLRKTLRFWVAHYNKGRPLASLGPGIPEPTVVNLLPLPHRERHTEPLDLSDPSAVHFVWTSSRIFLGKLCRMISTEVSAEHTGQIRVTL